MTILQVVSYLFLMAMVILIAGVIIVKRDYRKLEFDESVIFMRELIKESELSKTAYRNILDAFHEFDTIAYRNDKAYKSLWSDFFFKYKDFLPESDKIKIIPE